MFDGTCLIRRAGVSAEGWAQVDLKAENGAFDWQWFLSRPEMTREVLATALVAVSTGKRVHVQLDEPITAWSPVIRILVVA